MKKILLFLTFFASFTHLHSQTYTNTTVYTRNGTGVEGKILTSGEWTSSQKEALKNQTLAEHPNATFLSEATRTYNCHGYAWHLSEGQNPIVWINEYDDNFNPNIYKYFTDGSFIQVCNESDADKVHYYTGDHSAVISTTVSGKYESKWGQNIRIRHNPTDVPTIYNGGFRRYYATTKISGDISNLCTGTRTFSVKNIAGATYIWTFSSTLSVVGPTNTSQLTVQRNGSANGGSWVQVQISTPCSPTSVTNRVDFTVGIPDINNFDFLTSGPSCINYNNQSMYFGVGYEGNWGCQLKDLAGLTEVEWQVFCSNPHQVTHNAGTYTCYSPSYVNDAGLSIAFSYPTQPYVVTLRYRAKNACGWSEWSPGNYKLIQACGGGWNFVASPNPTNGSVNIVLDEITMKNDKTIEIHEVHIMDKFGKIVKQFKYGSANKHANLNISDLKPDVYFIKVFNGKEWKAHTIIKQ